MLEEKSYKNHLLKFDYPRHIKNTMQVIADYLKKVDLLLEVYDARIPYTSQNSSLQINKKEKHSIILFNKSDLANPKWNQKWFNYYQKQKQNCLFISLKEKKNLHKLKIAIQKIQQQIACKYKSKNIQPPAIRIMVLGLPNTGKSTIINYLVGNKKTHTGSKPGITVHSQWVKLPHKIEILDTPGILPPFIQKEEEAHKFYATYAVKENAELEPISFQYLFETCEEFRKIVCIKYKLQTINCSTVLAKIKERYRVSDNGLYQRIFTDFRQGVMGRSTLDCELPA